MYKIVSWPIAALVLYVTGANMLAPVTYDSHDYQGDEDKGLRVAVFVDGSVYVAGDGITTNGDKDWVLVKYDRNLNFVWERHYNDPDNSDDTVCGLVIDKAGNVYVGGTSYQGATRGNDFTVVAWDSSGTPLWSGDGARTANVGTSDRANGMAIDTHGETPVILLCGQSPASQEVNAVAVAFESDGSVKSGWPMVYGASSGYDEAFNAIDSDTTNGKVWAAGYKTTASEGKNILVVRYAGGGSQQAAFSTDYLDADDEAKDITFTKNGRVAVAGYETSSGSKLFAVIAYDEVSGIGPAWTNRYGSESESSACTYGDDFVYATGRVGLDADNGFLTKKIALSNGANASGWGTGKIVGQSLYHFGRAIWLSGTNVYVTGVGRKPDDDFAPEHNQYTTTAYSKDGTERAGFPDYFPITPYGDDSGYDVCARGVGGFYVTGDLIISDETKHDMGTLLYSVSTYTATPGSNFTILVGTRSGNESNPLDASDNTKLVVEHGTEPTSLAQVVSVEINGNVGTSEVTEMSFEVESLSESTIVQTVWLYNYDSGQYESFDSRAATTSDRTLYIAIPGDPDP